MTFSGRDLFASFYPPCKLYNKTFLVHFQSLMNKLKIFLG